MNNGATHVVLRLLRVSYRCCMPPEPRQDGPSDTNKLEYTTRLEELSCARWKKLIGAQAPYRWHIRRVVEGLVLDVGCGIGRNLAHLDGKGVGVDPNRHSVKLARERGLTVYTVEDFRSSQDALPGRYGTILLAHVLEHMELDEAADLVASYLPFLNSRGRIVVIVPQEAGFRSDRTHIAFVGVDEIARIANSNGLVVEDDYSFPFPRFTGRFFRHNETVGILRKS